MKDTSCIPLTKEQKDFFSAPLAPICFSDWLTLISDEIGAGCHRLLLSHHNLHSLYLVQKNGLVRQFYARSGHCYIDGVPVRWLMSILGLSCLKEHRFSLMHEFPNLLQYACDKNWKIFYLGSSKEVSQRAQQKCREDFPNLQIQFFDGYQKGDGKVIEAINNMAPEILLVGMGMPRQEAWLLKNIDELDVGVVTHAGGTLDYYVGAQAKPPRWVSDAGFAWLYRLMCNPARLWGRYLVEPVMLVGPVIRLWWAGRY